MKNKTGLTDSQKKFIDENYQNMTRLDMSVSLELESLFKVYDYCKKMGYQRKIELSEEQKQFIRDNYLKMTEAAILKSQGITRIFLQRFKREEGLFTYPKNRKEKKKSEVKELFFDVDAMESWVA